METELANKRLAKNTLLLYFRMLFMMGVNLFTSRIILQTLGVDDYGIYNVVGGVITMFSFVTASLSAGASRFITIAIGHGNMKEMKSTFGGIMAIQVILGILVLLIGETAGLWFVNNHLVIPNGRMYAAVWVFQFSVLACIISIINVPLQAEIIAHEKMSMYALVSILDAILKLVIVYALFVTQSDRLILYAFLIIIVQLIDFIIALSYCFRKFAEVKGRIMIDRDLSKSVLCYSSWTLTGAITSMTCNQGINILLNVFFGPAVNAARGIAFQVQMAVQSFATNFQTALNPQIVKSYAKKDYSRIEELVVIGTKFSFFLILLISAPIFLKLNFLLEVWLVHVPQHTEVFIGLLLLINLVHCALANPLIFAINATGDIKKFQIVEGLCLITILPISYIGYKIYTYSPSFVFIVYLIIESLTQIFRTLIVLPRINMSLISYFKKCIVPILLVIIVVSLGSALISLFNDDTWINFIGVCLSDVIIVISAVYFLGLNSLEKKIIVSEVKKIINRMI